MVSPSARQSGEFLRKASAFVRMLEIRTKGDGDNEMSLELPNGSRIVGLPGNGGDDPGLLGGIAAAGGRGGAGERRGVPGDPTDAGGERWGIVADEHALAGSGGSSTRRGRNGGPEWERILAPATECARIRASFWKRSAGRWGNGGSGRSICANSRTR